MLSLVSFITFGQQLYQHSHCVSLTKLCHVFCFTLDSIVLLALLNRIITMHSMSPHGLFTDSFNLILLVELLQDCYQSIENCLVFVFFFLDQGGRSSQLIVLNWRSTFDKMCPSIN